MTGFTQCKECKTIYKFPIVDDTIPPCPKCGAKHFITDDGGFLVNGLNPDEMYPSLEKK